MSKYTLYFQRFIGRSLTRRERNIIASLEYTRRHGLDRRVYVVDPPGTTRLNYWALTTTISTIVSTRTVPSSLWPRPSETLRLFPATSPNPGRHGSQQPQTENSTAYKVKHSITPLSWMPMLTTQMLQNVRSSKTKQLIITGIILILSTRPT